MPPEGTTSKVAELITSINALRTAVDDVNRKLGVSRRVQWGLGVLAIVMLCVIVVLSGTVIRLLNVVDEVKQSQVAACESGNDFRRDVIELNDQRDLNYSRALADITNAPEDRLVQFLQILAENRTIPESFQPRDCQSLYG